MDPITATYAHDDADWTITVSGLGKELTDRAPGIIAARDRADQLVEKVAPEHGGRTVVHLLNGSALDFTAAYIEARLTTPGTQSVNATGTKSADTASASSGSARPEDAASAGTRPEGTRPEGARSANARSAGKAATASTEATSASPEATADSADAETTATSEQKEAAVAVAASGS